MNLKIVVCKLTSLLSRPRCLKAVPLTNCIDVKLRVIYVSESTYSQITPSNDNVFIGYVLLKNHMITIPGIYDQTTTLHESGNGIHTTSSVYMPRLVIQKQRDDGELSENIVNMIIYWFAHISRGIARKWLCCIIFACFNKYVMINLCHTWVWNHGICKCVIVCARSHMLIVRRKMMPTTTMTYFTFSCGN